MIRRICITGPEATGKSFLAQSLSNQFGCKWVPEYAREYLEKIQRPYSESDLEEILHGQIRLEEEIAAKTENLLICDTGPEAIWVWSWYKYGRVTPFIDRVTNERVYDFTLLLETDLPWTPDPLRENPSAQERSELFLLFEELMTRTNRDVARISGQGKTRIMNALQALSEILCDNQTAKGVPPNSTPRLGGES